MAQLGNFGKSIIFETSSKKILTFNNFTQTVSARWGSHERVGLKPKKEFLGADTRKISLDIVLKADHGVRPRKTLEMLEALVEKGKAEKLVIGGRAVGANKWVITEMEEAWDIVMFKGELYQASTTLTMEEYC